MGTQIGFFVLTDDGDMREFGPALTRLGAALTAGLAGQPAAQFGAVASDERPTRDPEDGPAAGAPPPELVVAVGRWLDIEFDEKFAPEANIIRKYVVELACDPPPPGKRISYREARDQLDLSEAEHPWTSTAWSTVLRRFTLETGQPLLKKIGSPLYRGSQDTAYRLEPDSAAAVREAVSLK